MVVRSRPRHAREAEEAALQRCAPCALVFLAGPAPSPALPEDSHYAVLGLAPSATPAEVRRAYLRRVAAAHPDKGGDRAAFDAVQAAFAVLSNSTERLIYDEQLQRRLARSGGFGAAATTSGGGSSGRSCHSRQGVTVVVHGQTQGSPPAQQPCKAQHASSAGQRASCGSAELQAATAEIQRLQGGGGGGASAAVHAANLAAAHLQRAALHKAAGQLHHARFDAEEALRLAPGISRAAVLVAELEAAAAEEQASRGRGAGSAASDSDDSEF